MSATKFRPLSLIYFTAIVSVLFLGYTEAEDDIKLTRHNNGDDPEDLEEREGMIRLSPPTLDDEEQNSPHIPKPLRCDGCRAVAYQVKIHRDWGGGGCRAVTNYFRCIFKSMFLQRVDTCIRLLV